MTRERWWILGVLGALVLLVTGVHLARGTGPTVRYYVSEDGVDRPVPASALKDLPAGGPTPRVHWGDTIGIWIGALCTLAVFSFLYRDNPLYRVAEHVFVGISAAYWMTQGFWAQIVPNLIGNLFPRAVKFSAVPGLSLDEIVDRNLTESYFSGVIDYAAADGDGLSASWLQLMDPMYLGAAILGIMLLMRLGPKKTQWIAVWPLAVVIGTTAGLRLIAFSGADFVKQIDSTIVPLIQPTYAAPPPPADGAGTVPAADAAVERFHFGKTFFFSFSNTVLVLGVMCGLIYFFFSLEHKGIIGGASRVGIWVLMITFGGGFGYTVMGRITLLTARLEFLVRGWLGFGSS